MNILILKCAALGDVLRTTPILRVLKGEITWVTQTDALPLLKGNPFIHHLEDIRAPHDSVLKKHYQLVLNLEENPAACQLASRVSKSELVGPYLSGTKVSYTDSSKEWFDMSLISRFGIKAANRKKWENRKTYQEILFRMAGKKFKGEEYILPFACKQNGKISNRKMVGLETRSGERWIGKRWIHFPKFMELLDRESISYLSFRQYPTLGQFIRTMDRTDFVVTTDSLALHIALGLQKKVVALFTCTSHTELCLYGRAIKIVSPLLKKYYYSTERTLKSGESIPPEKVFQSLWKLYGKQN